MIFGKEKAMKRFGVLLASTALCTALLASGPALAFRGGGFGGFHGGGFRGGGFGFYGYPYGYYPPYYGDVGVCYVVRQRVMTRYGWRIRRVSVCE
jgi:hypothetical protein